MENIAGHCLHLGQVQGTPDITVQFKQTSFLFLYLLIWFILFYWKSSRWNDNATYDLFKLQRGCVRSISSVPVTVPVTDTLQKDLFLEGALSAFRLNQWS